MYKSIIKKITDFKYKLFCNHQWGDYNDKICQKCGKCRGLPIFENCPPPPKRKDKPP
jgi:hypothetical protein